MELSRPYQIALGGLAVLAMLWFAVLRPHAPSTSSSTPPASVVHTPAPPSTTSAKSLLSAVAKAHAVVTQSQTQAHNFSSASADPGTSAASTTPRTAPAVPAIKPATTHPSVAARGAGSHTGVAKPVTPLPPVTVTMPSVSAATAAAAVQRDLVAGHVVVMLIWDPSSADDSEVHQQLRQVGKHHGRVNVLSIRPNQLSSYSGLVKSLSLTQTPTVLVINHKGIATSLVGLSDSTDINQAVADALSGPPGQS